LSSVVLVISDFHHQWYLACVAKVRVYALGLCEKIFALANFQASVSYVRQWRTSVRALDKDARKYDVQTQCAADD
jgi:hypothetical protein